MSVTPASAQVLISESLIGRDALATSMVFSPTPLQNSLRPPEEPPDSTTGVLKLDTVSPKFSATILAYGSTVDEPAIWIWSRAAATPAEAASANAAAVEARRNFFMGLLLFGHWSQSAFSRRPARA